MEDFITAIGLLFVIEGALYALFPITMRKMIAQAISMPVGQIRIAGLIAAALGLFIVALVRYGMI
jgi:uncharacterized protein YjeT (DUF2065 family)